MEDKDKIYYFTLIPRSYADKSKTVQINFAPQKCEVTGLFMNTIPVLNADLDPSQPGFILNIDQQIHKLHKQQYQIQYDKKCKELISKETNMYVPKPKSVSKFCSLCKINYNEYLDHIQSKQHKDAFRKNKYIKRIETITTQIKNEVKSTHLPIEQSDTTESEPIQKKVCR